MMTDISDQSFFPAREADIVPQQTLPAPDPPPASSSEDSGAGSQDTTLPLSSVPARHQQRPSYYSKQLNTPSISPPSTPLSQISTPSSSILGSPPILSDTDTSDSENDV